MDSSQTGKAEEELIERLLKVEHADEPTEIVIHVKERTSQNVTFTTIKPHKIV